MLGDDSCKEPKTDLALTLGCSNQSTEKKLSSDSGAGANAGSELDMTFVAANTLSELVWSPQRGLSVKCADGNFLERKPSLLWDIPSNMVSGTGSNQRLENNKPTYEEQQVTSPIAGTNLGTDASGGNISSRFATPNAGGIAPLRTGELKQDVMQTDLNEEAVSRVIGSDDGKQMMEMNSTVLAPEVNAANEREREELPLFMENGKKHEMNSGVLETCKLATENELRGARSDNACGLVKNITEPESGHGIGNSCGEENDLLNEDKIVASDSSSTHSRNWRYRMKGKAKALSDGEAGGRAIDEDENSHESLESCNVVGHGKRRWSEQQLDAGSKRVRRHNQEDSPNSTSLVKHDSSFMNWIANMMKGFSKSKENQEPSCALTLTDADGKSESPDQRTIGFRSVFRSLYCLKTKTEEQNTLNIGFQVHGLEKLEVDNKLCDVNAAPTACRTVTGTIYKNFPFPHQKFTVGEEVNKNEVAENKSSCNSENSNDKNGTSSNSSHKNNAMVKVDHETTNNLGLKDDPRSSLWITRFTPKPLNQDVCIQANDEASNSAADIGNNFGLSNSKDCDEKSLCKVNATLPSWRLKTSEAMASVFSRRLDALKHIIPSEEATDTAATHTALTCFFCGVKGHHLRDCSEITNTELIDLLGNDNPYKDGEEQPCVCIRCFQLNHWAVACPNTSQRVRLRKEDTRMEKDLDLNSKLKQAITCGSNAKLFGKIASSSEEHKSKKNQLLPLVTDLVNRKISEVPKGIFDAVKRLRLSRADITRWMNACVPLSQLDGFFLRLRLGKWEEGLGGTGYHVASITGVQRGDSPREAKTCIAVNVAGISCLVKSQYISNHDFLEDELMAWWSATSTGGGKIPSEEGLRLKVEEKEMLGF